MPATRVRTRTCSTPSTTLGAPTISTAGWRTTTLILTCRSPCGRRRHDERARLAEAVRDIRCRWPAGVLSPKFQVIVLGLAGRVDGVAAQAQRRAAS